MTNERNPDAARIAEILRDYTQRTLRIQQPDGSEITRQPSLRWIERQTGIPHQRISDFLRNPENATESMLGRVTAAVEHPNLTTFWRGQRVGYLDAPSMTREVLSNFQPPREAVAFRFVVETDDERYKGFRSTEWISGVDRIDELADQVPGGRDAISRIVFDVGDE